MPWMMRPEDLRTESKAAFREVLGFMRGQARRVRADLARRVGERAARWQQILNEMKETAEALRIK
jgi:hypothetical protein